MRRDRAISEIIIIGIRSTVQKQGSVSTSSHVFFPAVSIHSQNNYVLESWMMVVYKMKVFVGDGLIVLVRRRVMMALCSYIRFVVFLSLLHVLIKSWLLEIL